MVRRLTYWIQRNIERRLSVVYFLAFGELVAFFRTRTIVPRTRYRDTARGVACTYVGVVDRL